MVPILINQLTCFSARLGLPPLLCLEIADLEQAMQTLDRPLAPVGHGPFGFGKGEEVGALKVVEIGQAVECVPLGVRQHGQPSAVAGARRLVALHGASVGWKWTRTFPIMRLFGRVSCPDVRRRLAKWPLANGAPTIFFGKVVR